MKVIHAFSRSLLACFLLAGTSCQLLKTRPQPDPFFRHPGGVIRNVYYPEKYVVFEASHLFEAGEVLQVMRGDGTRVGRVRVTSFSRKSFQAADILEGLPREGDVVEKPLASPQPEAGN